MAGRWVIAAKTAFLFTALGIGNVQAQNLYDPKPLAEQMPAVDGYNFTAAIQAGSQGGWSNHMFIGSATIPVYQNFGIQADIGIGAYGDDYTSAAGALHIFWRDTVLHSIVV